MTNTIQHTVILGAPNDTIVLIPEPPYSEQEKAMLAMERAGWLERDSADTAGRVTLMVTSEGRKYLR